MPRAIQITEYGGPEKMKLVDLSVGQPGPGEILIRHKACGLNFIDVYQRTGLYQNPLPLTLGMEASGVVEAVGEGVTHLKAGDRAAYDDAQELLSAIGPNLFYVGAAEEARVVKACLQLMLGGIVGILAEAVVLGDAAGLDRATLLGIINRSAVGAPVVGYKTAPLVARDYTPTFHTRLLDKDLSIGIDAASAHGLELPLAGHVRELNRACTAEGFGDLDFMSFVLHLQRLAGIPTDVDGGTA